MAYELRDFSQTAVDTANTGGISDVADTWAIDATTGWPTGGANGPFFAMVDYDIAGKELVLITSRTGNTLQGVARGQGGTTAATHQPGAKIRHIHTQRDADEANYAVSQTVGKVTTKGDMIVASAANTFARRAVGTNNQVLVADSAQGDGVRWGPITSAMLGTDSVTATHIAADQVGTSEIAPLAVTSAELATDSVIAGKIAAGAISQAGDFAAGVVDNAALANLAVTAGKIANDTITATQMAAGSIGASELANGAVSETADVSDAIITLAKFASEAGTTWGGAGAGAVGPFNNLTLGAGGSTYARHFKLGRLVVIFFGYQLGTGGDLPGTLGIDLPFNAAGITGFSGSDAAVGGFVAVRAFNQTTSERVSGTGVMATTEALNFVSAFTSSVWNFANPFDWSDAGAGSKLMGLGVYETA